MTPLQPQKRLQAFPHAIYRVDFTPSLLMRMMQWCYNKWYLFRLLFITIWPFQIISDIYWYVNIRLLDLILPLLHYGTHAANYQPCELTSLDDERFLCIITLVFYQSQYSTWAHFPAMGQPLTRRHESATLWWWWPSNINVAITSWIVLFIADTIYLCGILLKPYVIPYR